MAAGKHFLETELAARWNLSRRTLQRWRKLHYGPSYLRLGNHITYAEEDVVAFESSCRTQHHTGGGHFKAND